MTRSHPIQCFFLQLVSSVEVGQCSLDTGGHGLLSLTDPDSGTGENWLDWGIFSGTGRLDLLEVLLIGFIITVRVSDLLEKVFLLIDDIITDTSQVGVPIHPVSSTPLCP